MFELLVLTTALVIIVAMWIGYSHTRDPLMPLVVTGPMLLYMYVYNPVMLYWDGTLLERFSTSNLEYVQFYILMGTSLFCIGCLQYSRSVRLVSHRQWIPFQLSEKIRIWLYRAGCLLGVVAAGVFIYLVYLRGGPFEVFSRGKPYVGHPIGYVSELPRLSYPALLLLAIARQGRKLTVQDIAIALVAAMPQIVMGTLGGRRGPAFLIIATLAICWFIVRQRRPSIRMVIAGIVGLGLLMLFLVSNRENIHLGSESLLDTARVVDRLTLSDAGVGNEYIHGAGMVITAREGNEFYWGRRYFVQTLIRPIPRQIWPDQYAYFGMQHLHADPGVAGMTDAQWVAATGYRPVRGAAGGFLTDLYVELWWFGVVAAYGIGWIYAFFWRRFVQRRGIWLAFYGLLLALSVHLVAQSIMAWLYRALLLMVPIWVFWHYILRVRKWPASRRGGTPMLTETLHGPGWNPPHPTGGVPQQAVPRNWGR